MLQQDKTEAAHAYTQPKNVGIFTKFFQNIWFVEEGVITEINVTIYTPVLNMK